MTPYRPCAGPTRRDMLLAGLLAPMGLGLSTVIGSSAVSAKPARTRSVILLFMWGGPSHLDTWDPKPQAAADIRGEFKAIPTTVPGVFIGEHFPKLATRAKQYTIIRSMTHTDPAHLSPVHHLMTGRIAPKPNSDADGASRQDAPCIGGVVRQKLPAPTPMPLAVTLPWAVSHPAAPGGTAPGQNAGWLGPRYDPFLVSGNPNDPNFRVAGLSANPNVGDERMTGRAALQRQLDRLNAGPEYALQQQKALELLATPDVARAFDLTQEPAKVRDEYGRHPHGQSCLLARRLIEAGTRFVTVNWPDDGKAFWDTHGNNFPSLKTRLMPPADQGFAALLDDLTRRGLLDETLVIWVGEFGRTPKVENAGRQHWSPCYSAVLAGGGIRGGTVYGSSDRIGAYPSDNPVSPADMTATIYDALGIDPEQTVHDRLGRPVPLTDGKPLRTLFG